ncbi:4Fe-4S dicluster domain-containing protein [Candidatus Pacearchaeota archaeon]|nr:4Fe-4S dicluster domain-containing protein [Candidatus Pacearchaeota archaeon]
MQKIIPKSDFPKFINNLIKSNLVIAPIFAPDTKFQKVKSFDEIYLDKITWIPAKQHFQPEQETLLEFKKNKPTELEGQIPKTILFGLRKCDLNAIQVLDKVMYDKQYLAKRKNTVLIGIHCETRDKFCFCNSMELQNFHDLYIFPKGKNYIIDVQGEKGKALVENLQTLEKELPIPIPKNSKKLKNLNIAKNYKDSIWEADTSNCLSCSACTVYCPTCNCFDIKDNLNIDLKSGTRTRSSSSCQLKSFSKVAGGKSYRDSRLSRFKHFVYHKISYFKSQHGRPMCVGCGRCLRVCPTKIDWVKTINKLPKKKNG